MYKTKLEMTLLTVMLAAGTCLAQTETPKQAEGPKAYQLDFVLKELEDGKVINSRNYSLMTTSVGGGGSIRSGDKVPVVSKAGPQAEYTYLDVPGQPRLRSCAGNTGQTNSQCEGGHQQRPAGQLKAADPKYAMEFERDRASPEGNGALHVGRHIVQTADATGTHRRAGELTVRFSFPSGPTLRPCSSCSRPDGA